MRKFLIRAFVLFVLLGIAAAGFVYYSIALPYAGFDGETYVEVPRGAGPRTIARHLTAAGVTKRDWDFMIVRALRRKEILKAGEYRFSQPVSAWSAFDKIARGDVFYHELVVPEGSNIFDIGQSAQQLGLSLIKAKDFISAARNPKLIADLAPDAPSLEGYLFPATYQLTRKSTVEDLIREMTGRFRRAWKEVVAEGGPAGMSVNEAVALASLIEKETGVEEERPLVSSVFHNRLRQGIPLQCDPTTIYAALLEDRYKGAIHKSDLESTNRYNTYRHAGLPPGPIANPGLASLKAALRPVETDHLYFVAKPDGSGRHVFSSELAQHNAAVQEYRRGIQEAAPAKPRP